MTVGTLLSMGVSMRRAGILLPLFSLPGREPVGTLGAGARAFLDFAAESGFGFWQVLPVPPEGRHNCPYAGASAFAVDPLYLSLHDLADSGYLGQAELSEAMDRAPVAARPDRVPWSALAAWKTPLLRLACSRLGQDTLDDYLRRSGDWLEDWSLWWAISQNLPGSWTDWPEPLRDRHPEALRRARRLYGEHFTLALGLQYLVDEQWARLRRELGQRGIRIMGDLPLYVDGDGADVWAHRDLFRIQPDGRALWVAGVPPDPFSDMGQRWDNPVYDWEYSAHTGHAWWRARFRRLMELVDEVRVDHFRGFVAYYSFPFQLDPRQGEWTRGPGRGLFDALAAEYGDILGRADVSAADLPIVVEDLGYIDNEVEQLRDDLGFPGTKVLQFGFDGSPDNPYHPHNFNGTRWCVCTGTHDLPPSQGWYASAPDYVKRNFEAFAHPDEGGAARALVRVALQSRAVDVVIPYQDLLGLGDEARINMPGVALGNWEWRAPAPPRGVAGWVRELMEASGRLRH